MSYVSRKGRRPSEYASKSSHSHIINDPDVTTFLSGCNYPKESEDVVIDPKQVYKVKAPEKISVRNVVAIDGGRTPVPVKIEFPSSIITFYQFGALYFSFDDLENLYQQPFIEPSDISKLKEIQRYKYILPTKNVKMTSADSLLNSVRKSLSDFFTKQQPGGDRFADSLKWLVFEEFSDHPVEWNLSSCPNLECTEKNIRLGTTNISKDYTFTCPKCKSTIYLIDIFRFHEVVDNELGAGGIESYVSSVLEQIVLVHLIRIILNTKSSILNETIFIKDGPLAFFGQTAKLHKPMRNLINMLIEKHNIYLVGLEKSGQFVDNADELSDRLEPGTALILNNSFIYKYVIPGKSENDEPYGSTTYYGNKLYYKADDNRLYVASIPTKRATANPLPSDFPNLDAILTIVSKLKCDMYDSALIPISLVNKLVSLSNHPSSVILEKFARKSIQSC